MNGAPVFVKIDEYRDVLDILSLLKEKISEANGLLDEITDVKAKEDSEIENWQATIDEVENKISLIDKTLVEVNAE